MVFSVIHTFYFNIWLCLMNHYLTMPILHICISLSLLYCLKLHSWFTSTFIFINNSSKYIFFIFCFDHSKSHTKSLISWSLIYSTMLVYSIVQYTFHSGYSCVTTGFRIAFTYVLYVWKLQWHLSEIHKTTNYREK